ncbi:MAG: S-methyl-5-thioribose-1-phosphate isomerase [Clostridiales bacterium]|jgi:methylthioribose-1-phosphate isomerase|nr:S-methyl-5-thioribose-1-phosphate isomerase [Clostridiales bacterium]
MENIRYDEKNKQLYIIDQSLLPNEEKEVLLNTAEEMYDAIKALKVRGAPAIGICAAYCLYVLSLNIKTENSDDFYSELKKRADYLNSSRPTAVNLSWALNRMVSAANKNSSETVEYIRKILYEEAKAIHSEDIEMCLRISEFGLTLVKDGDGILTHCNAGPLATSRYGTALGPILLGTERGMKFHVFADETRPLLQGARLTSYELYKAGVDVTLICDNMANTVMRNGWVQAVFVGCDRVAANGDTANKIGTCGVAVLAKHYGIPFYILGPTSTIDLNCKTGADIEIEERDPEEIKKKFYAKPMALDGVKCFNPAFDVTDNELITGIVTQKGICRPPYTESLAALFRE